MTRLSGHLLGIWHKHGRKRASDGPSLGGTSMVTQSTGITSVLLQTIKTLGRPRYSGSKIAMQAIYTGCSFNTDRLFMLNITHQNNPSPKRLNISSPFDSLRITHRYIREFDLSSTLHSTCCLTKHLRHLTGSGINNKFIPERKGKGKK